MTGLDSRATPTLAKTPSWRRRCPRYEPFRCCRTPPRAQLSRIASKIDGAVFAPSCNIGASSVRAWDSLARPVCSGQSQFGSAKHPLAVQQTDGSLQRAGQIDSAVNGARICKQLHASPVTAAAIATKVKSQSNAQWRSSSSNCRSMSSVIRRHGGHFCDLSFEQTSHSGVKVSHRQFLTHWLLRLHLF